MADNHFARKAGDRVSGTGEFFGVSGVFMPVARRYEALPPSLPPRGLCREAAARYIGVSPTKFDEMVTDGRMPGPKQIDSRVVWDRIALDLAFEALPGDGESNPWDAVT